MAAQCDDQAIGARDLVVAQLGDDVALLNSGLSSRTILNDARHIRAAIGAQLVGAGVKRIDARKCGAQIRMNRRLAADDLVGNVLGVVNGNSKAHARAGARIALDERVDAHQLTIVVNERATRVARVDGGIGLDHVGIDSVTVGRAHGRGAIQCRHNARGDRLLVAERRADGHDPLAHVELGGITDLDRRELGGVGILELDDGQVARGVVAHELGLVGGAVVHGHHVLVVAVDHVVVGEDVALGIEHHARADAARAVRLVGRLRKRAILATARSGGNGNHGGQGLSRNGLGQRGILGVNGDLLRRRTRSTRRHGILAATDIERAAHNERNDQQGSAGTAGKRRNKDRQLFGLGLDHRVLVHDLLATQRLAGLRVVGLHVGNVAVGRRRLHLHARLLLGLAGVARILGTLGIVLAHSCDPFVK